MGFEFGEIIWAFGTQFLYCGQCPVKPDLLSIVIPVNDISNPQKVLSADILTAKNRVARG